MAQSLMVYGVEPETPVPAGAPVVGLVPAEAVAVRSVAIPVRGRRHADNLIRYAVEDSLAEDLDTLHVSAQSRARDGEIPVLVARKREIAEWLGWFEARQVVARSLLPDFYRLPWSEGRHVVAVDDGRALVRNGPHSGFAVAESLLPACLGPDAGLEEAPLPGRIELVEGRLDDRVAAELASQGWEIVAGRADGAGDLPVPGLRSGPFAPRGRGGMRLWYAAAAVGLIALVLELALGGVRYWLHDANARRLDAQATALFSETFPGVGRIVDIDAQSAQQLRRLQALRAASESGFESMLARVSAVLETTPRVGITGLRYSAGRLELNLVQGVEAPLGGFVADLQRAGLAVERAGNRLTLRWRDDA